MVWLETHLRVCMQLACEVCPSSPASSVPSSNCVSWRATSALAVIRNGPRYWHGYG